jgi:hypothetical protein
MLERVEGEDQSYYLAVNEDPHPIGMKGGIGTGMEMTKIICAKLVVDRRYI